MQFVVGTGGKAHGFATPIANADVYNTDTYGVLKLTVHRTRYDFQFVPEAGKTFGDSGGGTCH